MPWALGVDQWADPSKQCETRRDMIARRHLMFEQGEREKEKKTKTKGANPGLRCGRPPTGGAERGAGWNRVRGVELG